MPHFTKEQLQELATIFGLTMAEETLPVRDGVVTKETYVWWRGTHGPEKVLAERDWKNIRDYPGLYQLKKPEIVSVTYFE